MKDKKLNEKFGEYFKGIDTPENITADAKKFVKPSTPILPRLMKWAAAAAGVLFICVVSVLALRDLPAPGNDAAMSPSSSEDMSQGGATGNPPDAPNDAAQTDCNYYDKNMLVGQACTPNAAAELHPALAVISGLDGKGASVTDCTAYYCGDILTLVTSEISITENSNSYDASLFIELTNSVYRPLAEYSYGDRKIYNGNTYYLTQSATDNGGHEFKVLLYKGNIKYYFDVVSDDGYAYLKILNLFFD